MRKALCIASAATVLAGLAAPAAQQSPRFAASVDTVEVYATVRARGGELVRDLTKDDFDLFDNGTRQEIALFSHEIQPITIAFLLDRSGSIGGESGHLTEAAEAFVRTFIAGDRASVQSLSFDCQPLTSDTSTLVAMLRGSSRMHDIGSPVWSGLERTIASLGGEPGRRAILMFSDGHDNGSFLDERITTQLRAQPGPCRAAAEGRRPPVGDVARRAARDGLMIYAVGVHSPTSTTMDANLKRIAGDSGGEFFWLMPGKGLTETFTRIADELHHQYVLGFTPAVFDGKEHKIEVRSTRVGLTVRARDRYVADRGSAR